MYLWIELEAPFLQCYFPFLQLHFSEHAIQTEHKVTGIRLTCCFTKDSGNHVYSLHVAGYPTWIPLWGGVRRESTNDSGSGSQ